MITVYIKKNEFFKNVDPFGNIFEIEYPTRDCVIVKEDGVERIEETYDDYIENGFVKIELDVAYQDCVYEDFNADFTFSIEKYNTRKQKEIEVLCENLIVSKIRKKYTVNQEFAIQRKRYIEPEKFEEYDAYVEKCIMDAKAEVKNATNKEFEQESVSEERESGDESRQEQETSIGDCLFSEEEI